MCLLEIKKLSVNKKKKNIINNLNLKIKSGEIHILMGPNGSGKSTLSLTIAGDKRYKVTKGKIKFKTKNILKLPVDEIAKEGLFVSFQNTIEIPGLKNQYFLYKSINSIRKYNNKEKINFIKFKEILYKNIKKINFPKKLLNRSLNKDFSGGEKKKNDLLQILLLKPKLIILDEIDSSLDINTFKTITKIINKLKQKKTSFLIITHNHKIFEYIKINLIHILYKGEIIYSGNKNIYKTIEKYGYDFFKRKKYKKN